MLLPSPVLLTLAKTASSLGHSLLVLSQAQAHGSHAVDEEEHGEVDVPVVLTGIVVKGEGVVEVVEVLTCNRNKESRQGAQ